jgi:predicted SAM-dependent methyltransferase
MGYWGKDIGTTFRDLEEVNPLAFPSKSNAKSAFQNIRRHITPDKKILEVGPLLRPMAAKRDGYNVYILDKLDRDGLIRFYHPHIGDEVELIEEVDFVWEDGELLDSLPAEHHQTFDAIILSHVLEHVPNPLGLLKSCHGLLKPGGVISLALPDKRFCFDLFRPLTTTSDWIEALLNRDTVHTRKTLFTTSTTAVAKQGLISWPDGGAILAEQMTFVTMALEDAFKTYYGESKSNAYIDCHAWVFTPSSFALIAHECHALGICNLSLESITTTEAGEFFVHLQATEKRSISHHERLQLMALTAREQVEGLKLIEPAKRRKVRAVAKVVVEGMTKLKRAMRQITLISASLILLESDFAYQLAVTIN